MKRYYYPVFLPLLLLWVSSAYSAPSSGLHISLKLNGVLELNKQCQLVCTVEAKSDAHNVEVSFNVPPEIETISKVQVWKGDIASGETKDFEITIKPIKAGLYEVEGIAISMVGENSSVSASDLIYLEILQSVPGKALTMSQIVSQKGTNQTSITLKAGDIKIIMDNGSGLSAEPEAPVPDIADDDSVKSDSKGTITIVGRLLYHHSWDASGVWRPVINATVQAWDYDVTSADDYLGQCVSDWDGRFSITVNNSDVSGTADVYLKFYLSNSRWKVLETTCQETYWAYTGVKDNVSDGTVDFGDNAFGAYTGAVAVFAAMNYGWNYATISGHDPGFIQAVWPVADDLWEVGTCEDNGVLYISTSDAYSQDIVVHEYAHAMMEKAYDFWWPPNATGTHQINKTSNVNMAWTEGFADFYPVAVYNDGHFNWNAPSTADPGYSLETPYAADAGDACEARVAGSLLDIYDYNNDGYDQYGCGFDEIWNIVWNNNNSTFSEFWGSWKNAGYNKHDVVQCIYNNTIDYDTAPTLADLPNLLIYSEAEQQNVFDLDDYAYDPESEDNQLNFRVVNSSDPNCIVAIDSDHKVDFTRTLYWYGESNVTIEVSDNIKTAQKTFNVKFIPPPNVWYVESFGTNPDATVTFDTTNMSGGAQIKLQVNNTVSPGAWVQGPVLRKDITDVPVTSDTRINWQQYDKDHALLFELLVTGNDGASRWLTYGANASNHWATDPGFVNMAVHKKLSDGTRVGAYNLWEQYSRNIAEDYLAEFGAMAATVKELRIEHYSYTGWAARDHGGTIKNIVFTQTPSLNFTTGFEADQFMVFSDTTYENTIVANIAGPVARDNRVTPHSGSRM